MQTKDWLERWDQNRIGFHEAEVNAFLKQYFSLFKINPGDDIFMPLCGKAQDIAWLAQQGFGVIGIELSPIAIEAFFSEQELDFQTFESERFILRKSGNISLYQGDYFDLQAADLASCKMVYDRASLIAIDASNRSRYCRQMMSLVAADAEMLVITLDYDQAQMEGPPFAVPEVELVQHYQNAYQIDRLDEHDALAEKPRWREQGLTRLTEVAYQLSKKK